MNEDRHYDQLADPAPPMFHVERERDPQLEGFYRAQDLIQQLAPAVAALQALETFGDAAPGSGKQAALALAKIEHMVLKHWRMMDLEGQP